MLKINPKILVFGVDVFFLILIMGIVAIVCALKLSLSTLQYAADILLIVPTNFSAISSNRFIRGTAILDSLLEDMNSASVVPNTVPVCILETHVPNVPSS